MFCLELKDRQWLPKINYLSAKCTAENLISTGKNLNLPTEIYARESQNKLAFRHQLLLKCEKT